MKRSIIRSVFALSVAVAFIGNASLVAVAATYGTNGQLITTTTAAPTGPVISSLSASSASAGQSVTIYGSNFTTSQCVLFSNGTTASKVDISASAKSFTVPSSLSVGSYTLRVAGTDCLFFGYTGASSNAVAFTVIAPTTTTVTATPTPSITFSASPASITAGQNSLLSWSTQNAQRCYLNYGSTQITAGVGGSEYVYPTQTTTYTLLCYNDPGVGIDGPSASKTTTVTVSAATETTQTSNLHITSPLDGASWTIGDAQTFRWTTTGLASNLTGYIDLVGGGVSYRVANVSNGGSYSWGSVGTSLAATIPAGTYSVKILINGIGDIVGPLTLVAPYQTTTVVGPTLTASVSPSTVTAGQSATITWTSTNTQNCVLRYGSTQKSIGTSGSRVVTPTATTNYEVRCANSAGTTVSKTVTVTLGAATNTDTFFGGNTTGGTTTFGSNADVDPRTISSCVNLTADLGYRMTGAGVLTLQDYLQGLGYLNSEPTGYFGLMTKSAVMSFQGANSIPRTGYVGPFTRAKIKALTCQ